MLQSVETVELELSNGYRNEGIGIPPKIKTNKTTTIIAAIISGTRKRNTASAMTAIAAIISSVSVDPSNANISIAMSNHLL